MESAGGNAWSLTLRAHSWETAPVHSPMEVWPGLGELNSTQEIVFTKMY
jgi:hypothetical protein